MKYKRRNSASLMFLYGNVNSLTIKLHKSYNSLYQSISVYTKFSKFANCSTVLL